MTKQELETSLIDAIRMLSIEQRKALREKLERQGITRYPRNLVFDYDTQTWI